MCDQVEFFISYILIDLQFVQKQRYYFQTECAILQMAEHIARLVALRPLTTQIRSPASAEGSNLCHIS